MKRLLAILALLPCLSFAQVPERARELLPILSAIQKEEWASLKYPSILAGQIEQETCISLKSKKCWNPRTELKTDREYGFGLGQLTVTSRFNSFEEVKKMDSDLKPWKWEDRYDPAKQMRALVVMDRQNFRNLSSFSEREFDQTAFALASYNGGVGGTRNDILLCRGTKGCDPTRWFGNVEKTSTKSKIKVHGYGKSFFEINREYVDNIMNKRRQKYIPFMGEDNVR